MKKYDVKFQVISENIITIPASSKKEALEKAKDLLNNSNIKDLDIKNITKHYVVLEFDKKPFLIKRKQLSKQ